MSYRKTGAAVLVCVGLLFSACRTARPHSEAIAVFVPGIMADSPIYAMLAEGVQAAVDAANTTRDADSRIALTLFEAGTNQAEWGAQLTALAAEGTYSVIISSNPSLPDLVEPIAAQFPEQKFILLDATKAGNRQIATVCYNQREQAYVTGSIAARMSQSHQIGLIAAQEYPVMNNIILPGFQEGANAAVPGTTVDFRVIGSWSDASKGAELAAALHNTGVDVILPICGGAAQGVISTAQERGMFITWFDSNGFDRAPGTVISSTIIRQADMAEQMTAEYLAGKTAWGTARTVGIADGFIDFVQDDPRYTATVPLSVRDELAALIGSIQDGTLALPQ
ncbi:MAG: BMP family ABC transporter substrate-binding protein [Treponema sp.]|nr:BMP family ABC transporter substrate-binding protein [Treponema sp.]